MQNSNAKTMARMSLATFLTVATILLNVGCADDETDQGAAAPEAASTETEADAGGEARPRELLAQASIRGSGDSMVSGTVTMTQFSASDRVTISASISGLGPGEHGLHVHRDGDCSADDFSSAGPHFQPQGSEHGAPSDLEHHAGDLGNIEADASGVATLATDSRDLSLQEGNPSSVVSRAVIVHRRADDLHSQPSGDAGARVGCGVLRLVDAERARSGAQRPGPKPASREAP